MILTIEFYFSPCDDLFPCDALIVGAEEPSADRQWDRVGKAPPAAELLS
jgi:hypothetical protein